MSAHKPHILIAGLVLTLAACSASSAPSSTPAGASQGAVQRTPTSAPTSKDVGARPAAGGTITNWCLNTIEEVSAALKVAATEAVGSELAGVGGGCMYNDANKEPIYALSIVRSAGAAGTFDAALAQAGGAKISGIGDGAVLVTPQGPLLVLKGSVIISMSAHSVPITDDATAYRAALEGLARSAAGRLP